MNTITEDYVSIETAKLLKDKGFPQNPYICNTAYTLRGKLSNNAKSFVHNFTEFDKCGIKPITYSMAPTLQMAMKWLREVHDIHIEAVYTCNYYYKVKVNRLWLGDEGLPIVGTYEYVIERGIKYCLENLI